MPPVVTRSFRFPSIPQLLARQRDPVKKRESVCDVALFEHAGSQVLLAVDREDNDGTRVADAADYLATLLCAALRLDPARLVFVVDTPWETPRRAWVRLEVLPAGRPLPGAETLDFRLREVSRRELPDFALHELIGEQFQV